MEKCIFIIALCLISVSSLQANTLHLYQDPVLLGDYVKDQDEMLTKALKRHGWVYLIEGNRRFANLSHKTYEINAELVIKDAEVTIKFIDAARPECTEKRCDLDMDKVNGWLVKLRRSIAYDLTLLVRDDAIRRSYL